jgi:non-ribosomal peptide synthetase-like protein
MQDIYLNPSIEKLARYVDSLPEETMSQTAQQSNRESFYLPSDFAYYGCGTLQAALIIAGAALSAWIAVAGIEWSYAAMPDLGATYLRVVAFSFGFAVALTALPIAAKWLLIGKFKPEVIPVWSLRYFRFWVVKTLIRSAPMAQFGGPIYNLYLRLLGAKIGANAVIFAKYIPVCTDLISIGENTIVRKDSIINGYKALSNRIHTGPIQIGADAFVGEGAIIDINTVMEDGAQLGHASSLHDGQRVEKGKHYHGCPGVETTANYCKVEPRECTSLRRWTYSTLMMVAGFALAPIPLMVLFALFPDFNDCVIGQGFEDLILGQALPLLIAKMALLSFAVYFAGVAL